MILSKLNLWPSNAHFLVIAILAGVPGRLMAQAADAAEDIRGPKALVEIPQPEKFPVALWAGIGCGIVLLAIAIYLWKRRSRKQRLKSPPEIALAALAQLEAASDQLAAEAFANRAAGTVRQYIADRFGLAAPRRTTEEFFMELGGDGVPAAIAESGHLKAFLKSCDLAKFAALALDSGQRGELLQAARAFVAASAEQHSNSTVAKP